MKVLITGGAGFIGSNLIKQLQKDGVSHIAVIDDFSTGFRENLQGLDVELFEGSILDQDLLSQAAHKADAIVHLAARPSVPRSIQDPLASHHANATGTMHVLEAARKWGAHVTLASSSSIYGSNQTLPKSEQLRPMPISPYAVSKLATETYALAYNAVYGLEVMPFRFFNVYGPGQAAGHAYAAVVPAFVDAALAGRPLPIHGDGEQTRDFTFVETVTETLSLAARERINPGDAVNLAFGTRSSLLDVVTVMEEILGFPLERDHQEPRAGDVRDSQAANDVLIDLFPAVQPVALGEGLEKTIEWFKSRS
ncbi:NAD-dependent epimerase/dehydratase family protein [Corynebacterium marinum]|uniref:GDP-D-mannose dehydratase n=1 Tax=Corynebacterium marinum DSM 44953 TaxID=1224162 RepID=A0A0B6TXH5_9CORY|nr:NAD-dependent epimerase/dehydratase family protein [Corynebacterium marinum]AJK69381.1 GDP-D-mannose dehydratase [Corynebacterium marinum DSM 44953]GGO21937.1 UDP-glucose 4-epimerase-like protein [Corynebacterium marinum]